MKSRLRRCRLRRCRRPRRRRSRRLRARSSSRSWRLPSHASASHAASCSNCCAGPPRKLTLIRAPAGWGKSTLLADWHALESETRTFAWVALDADDNDPVRFWTYLIHALRTLDPSVGDVSLPMLRAPRVSVVDDVLPALCNELTALPRPGRARARRLPPGHEPGDRRGPLLPSRAPSPDRRSSCSRAVPSRRSRSPAYAPAANWPRSTRNNCASPTRRPTSFSTTCTGSSSTVKT